MQIQTNVSAPITLGVSVTGSKGPITNVPVAFSLTDPSIATLAFDQAAMTLTITPTGIGSSDLLETYDGVSNTHSLTVTDTVIAVDLFALPTEPVTGAGETTAG